MYDDFFAKAQELRDNGQPFATATVVRAERPTSGKPGDKAIITLDGVMYGWIGGSCAQPAVVREAVKAIADDRGRLIRLSTEPGKESAPEGMEEIAMTCFSGGTLEIYIEPQQPRPHLLVVGNLPVARSLVHLGKAMSYRVIAIDPEAGGAAMAGADEVLAQLDELGKRVTPLTSVVVATHGNFDEPALARALRTMAPYVGLVASPKRGATIRERLREQGLTEEQVQRLRAPAGLDIGARRGDEIALSIMAEIVEARRAAEKLNWTAELAAQLEKAPAALENSSSCCGEVEEEVQTKGENESCCGAADQVISAS